MDFSGFNIVEVVIAALSAFVLGGLWYGPLFGKRWQAFNALSDERIAEANMPVIYGLAFLINLVIAFVLSFAIEIAMTNGSGLATGAAVGAFLALIFVAPAFGLNYLFARRPLALYGIDVGYLVLQFALMGAIMGAWT